MELAKISMGFKIGFLVVAASLGVSAATSTAGASAASVVIGTDPAGDWGDEPRLAPLGDALGQDLIEASLTRRDPDTVTFTMTFTNLPDSDPTVTGYYLWGFDVGKSPRALVSCGNFVGECQERENFVVLGKCTEKGHPVFGSEMPEFDCERLGEVPGEFNSGTASISIPVPLEMMKAKRGSVLKLKGRWVLAASSAMVFAGGASSDGSSWERQYNFDVLEASRNYRIGG